MKSIKDMVPLASGHVSLDFINTEVVRRSVRHDLLETVEDLEHWVQAVQANRTLHPEQSTWKVANWPETWFLACKEFRREIRNEFEQIARDHTIRTEFIEDMESRIRKAPFGYGIRHGELVALSIGAEIDQLFSLIAFDILRLIQNNELVYLRTCHNPDCVLLFIDAGGRRKWCSMKICGNRTKVARHQGKRASDLQASSAALDIER